jgi:hypothetical protein
MQKTEATTIKPRAKSGIWILYSLFGLIAFSGAVYLLGHVLAPIAEKTFGVYCY